MKFFGGLIVIALLAALVGPFVLSGPNGEKIMSLSDLMPNFGSGSARISDSNDSGPVLQSGEEAYYKWRDADGVWQFSQTPPPEGIQSDVVIVNPQANIIQSLGQEDINKTLGIDTGKMKKTAGTGQSDNGLLSMGDEDEEENSLPLPTTVPVDKIPQLIEKAKQVQELSNQRIDSLNQQIDTR